MTWNMGAGLEGKGVVITGASGGIGLALIRAFASTGAHIAAFDIKKDPAAALLSEIGDEKNFADVLDLRLIDSHERVLDGVLARLGRLDVLVHVAGVLIRRNDIDEVTEEDWDIQHDTNLKATFFLNRAAARVFRRQARGGRIINFASQGWWTGGFGGSVVYSASKGGIVSLTRGLARTYAKDKITVNAVAPGGVDTPMLRSDLTEAQLQGYISQIPMGYVAPPSDLAGAVIFLASEHASYVTGATINVSGGWLMY